MAQIHAIPLDAWVHIMVFLASDQTIVQTFNTLFDAGVFNAPASSKLNIFWHITLEVLKERGTSDSYALRDTSEQDSKRFQKCMEKLSEMGLSDNYSIQIARESLGDIHYAFDLLGWNA